MSRIWNVGLAAVVGAAAWAGGCASSGGSGGGSGATMTQAAQQAMTPDQALGRLAEGNRRFMNGRSEHRDYPAQVRATARAQYPFAVVLSCIDSRSAPELVFDQGIGDLFVPRVAGNYAPADMLGSMEFATKVAGARLIVVMGHTECGAIKGAVDNVQLGNLTTVIDALRPAVADVTNVPGPQTSSNSALVLAATEMNVRRTMAVIRRDSPIIRQLEESGQIRIVGAMHDVATGGVVFLN